MKNKFRLWLNIVTICLCVCAIAIGVYSATTATLNISGEIGFTAHGCDIDAEGYIYGHGKASEGVLPQDGEPVQAPAQDGTGKVWLLDGDDDADNKVLMRNTNDNKATLSIPANTYFTDMNSDPTGKPTDIVVVLTIYNQSLFDVHGIVTAESKDSNILATSSAGVLELNAKAGETVDQTNVTITLSVKPDSNGNYNKIDMPQTNNIEISIEFNKGKIIKGDATTGYYIEMGEYTNSDSEVVPLRWYPFAKLDSSGTVIAKVNDSTLNYKQELTSGTYYFISEYVLTNKSYRTPGDGSDGNPDSNGYIANGDYNYGLDYNGSTIQQYISGDMLTEYNIMDDVIYNTITRRTLVGESYIKGEKLVDPEMDKWETVYGSTQDTPNQSLWLLSTNEYQYLESTENTLVSKNGYPINASSAVSWWLRTPYSAKNNAIIWSAESGGYCEYMAYASYEYGVRPAFQITIA